ncbi:MAG TPA: PH domain-containing protein [Burkholderiales bacterium]|nr:PH domain-containing protein [Burkholderiales bacterium]
MGYINQNLLPGEEVKYRAKLHWIIYFGPVVLGLLGLIFLLSSAGNRSSPDPRAAGMLMVIGVVLLILAALLFLSRWIRVKTSEFGVTNKRVIIKVGLIQRHTLELLLAQVETIGVDQGIMGRILGYGKIVVVGTGGTNEPFSRIARPLEFRRQVEIQALAKT